jgi:hypothetical protein
LTFSAVAWIAIAAAGYFLFLSEQQLASRRTALRQFDHYATETAAALADLRASQQAYVAAGQGVAFWMPKVEGLIHQIAANVETLRASATAADGRQPLAEVAEAITELDSLDQRSRDYIASGDQLMASDVVFTEGGEAAASAAQKVDVSRLAEYRAFDDHQAEQRRLEALVLGGAAGLAVLVIAVLAFAPAIAVPATVTRTAVSARVSAAELPLRKAPLTATVQQASEQSLESSSGSKLVANPVTDPVADAVSDGALRDAAAICTEFGCVKDAADLTRLLARSAHLIDATGLIVWLGDAEGGDLRPLLAHGYAEQTMARIPPLSRSADNAAAAAYRTGTLQIVRSKAGRSSGALAAPLLAANGCIGSFAAEIRDGGEASERTHALMAIVAAQLAAVLAASVTTADAANGEGTATPGRAASA